MVYESLEKSRALQLVADAGAVKVTVALVRPEAGALVLLLRYLKPTRVPSSAVDVGQ